MSTRIKFVTHEGIEIFLLPGLKFYTPPDPPAPAEDDDDSSAAYYDYLANEAQNPRSPIHIPQ